MYHRLLFSCALCFSLFACNKPDNAEPAALATETDPMARDSFFMRNPEIREDLLNQLTIHDIEFWINEDNSIGFYARDTKEVDRLANEAIGVYISLQ